MIINPNEISKNWSNSLFNIVPYVQVLIKLLADDPS